MGNVRIVRLNSLFEGQIEPFVRKVNSITVVRLHISNILVIDCETCFTLFNHSPTRQQNSVADVRRAIFEFQQQLEAQEVQREPPKVQTTFSTSPMTPPMIGPVQTSFDSPQLKRARPAALDSPQRAARENLRWALNPAAFFTKSNSTRDISAMI